MGLGYPSDLPGGSKCPSRNPSLSGMLDTAGRVHALIALILGCCRCHRTVPAPSDKGPSASPLIPEHEVICALLHEPDLDHPMINNGPQVQRTSCRITPKPCT